MKTEALVKYLSTLGEIPFVKTLLNNPPLVYYKLALAQNKLGNSA